MELPTFAQASHPWCNGRRARFGGSSNFGALGTSRCVACRVRPGEGDFTKRLGHRFVRPRGCPNDSLACIYSFSKEVVQ